MKKRDEERKIEFPDQKIVDVVMEKEVKKAFLEYSMSVIVARALPDVRDGMKPVQRRVLYAMFEDNLTSTNAFRKSATTVGDVLGRYHPHGDSSVYGTMVRMAQKFSLRYPLVEGHGNFGSVDGDGAAAYRYTEARLSKISDEMMKDLNKNVVDFVPNFDYTRKEPSVLPARFPNLLVNGSIGIAVGMATYIPPHNLNEVIDGTIYLMDHPEANVTDLMQYIKGPDFPTKATIYGTSGIVEAYTTGRGKVMVRAKAEIDEDKHRIIITEIPYQVNKSDLVKSMADQVREKKIDGVTGLRDESGKAGMRIVVEYRHDCEGQIILNQFYKYTQLEDTCAMNMVALVNGVPKLLGLKEILENYIIHQVSVITRRTQFDLDKALHEEHIFQGYKIAIDYIDEVIKLIRASSDTQTAKLSLEDRFGLSDEQADAIVKMPLGRLSGLERKKIEDHLEELEKIIVNLKDILSDDEKIRNIVKEEMTEIKDKYGDGRLTELVEAHDEIMLEDLIPVETCVITATHAGYIKRLPADTYSAQNRGGKGITAMSTKEEDFIEAVFVAGSHSNILFFTNSGKVFCMKTYRIPEAGRTAKGTNIINLLNLESDEQITTVLPVDDFNIGGDIVFVTENGIIKKTPLLEYKNKRSGGKKAINLDDGDSVRFVALADDTKDIIIGTKKGFGGRFPLARVSTVGRVTRGVRAVRLTENDAVVGAALVENDPEWLEDHKLITITENGYGKRSDTGDFEAKNRGIKGVKCHNINEKTGSLCGISIVRDDQDIMMITDAGTIIRIPADGISTFGRTAGGVRVMRLTNDAKIVNVTVVDNEKDNEEQAEETGEEINNKETTEVSNDDNATTPEVSEDKQ